MDIRPHQTDAAKWAIKVSRAIPFLMANQVVCRAVRQGDNMEYVEGGYYHIFIIPTADIVAQGSSVPDPDPETVAEVKAEAQAMLGNEDDGDEDKDFRFDLDF